MSFRTVIISKSSKLDLKLNHLVVRQEEIVKIPISEIAVLLIESTATSVTSALLCELIKQKVKVIFCDEKRNPCSELVAYYGSHDTSLKLRNQIKWNIELKKYVWTEIVKLKLLKQSELLKKLSIPQYELLEEYITQVEFYDETNREGHAAKVYFNALFGKEFTRTTDNAINASLNYGYSIILSAFNREIVSAGYLTSLGLFHDNMFNQFNLSCDLMEIFRPLVDEVVAMNPPKKFDNDVKRSMVNLINKKVFIDGKEQYLLNAIKIYVRSIFDILNQVENSYIKVYRNEL